MAERTLAVSSVPLHPNMMFNGVKVFSATLTDEREQLAARVADWLAHNRHLAVVDMVTTQSSDAQYHCVAITVFYYEDPATLAAPRLVIS